jgi:hypothetical protein
MAKWVDNQIDGGNPNTQSNDANTHSGNTPVRNHFVDKSRARGGRDRGILAIGRAEGRD